jgi:recombination protein RecA
MPEVTFEDVLASLDKDTRAQLKIGSEISYEKFPTASFRLNRLLGGGFRRGKQHTLWGQEQSAKTAFALQSAAVNQRLGQNIAWVDAEHSFDPEWAFKLGLDPDRVLVSEVSTISELTNLQVKLVNAGIDMIFIDSTAALMPKSFVDKDGNLKPFEETGQLGQMAKDLGQMCKMVQGINWSSAIVHISQARVDVGSPAMHKPMIPIGGKEVRHTDALRIRFSASAADDKQIKENIQTGKMVVEERVGFPVNWLVNKNKINGRYGANEFNFYLGNGTENAGVDTTGEIFDIGVERGIVEKSGVWYNIYGKQNSGRRNSIAYLKENPQIAEKLEAEIDAE